MALANTQEKFGSLTKLLHWSIAALFFIQFYLMYRREYFKEDSPESLQYLLLHESLGCLVFLLGFLMLIWRHIGTRPTMLPTMTSFQIVLARATHFLLYVSMLLQPLSGISMSVTAGYPVAFFDLFTLPNFLSKNEALSKILYTTHVWSSYVIIGLVTLHILAVIYHHVVKRDVVLRRML